MIRKSLMALAMVCLLAASASISAEMASEEGAVEASPLNLVDEESTTADVDEMNNGSSLNSTGQSSTKIVIELSTLGNGSAKAEGPEATVISYSLSSSNTSDGEEAIDVRVLGNVLGASPNENVTDLSTLGEVSTKADDDNATEIGYTSPSVTTIGGVEATDVKVLSEALGY